MLSSVSANTPLEKMESFISLVYVKKRETSVVKEVI